nr:ATP synthase F0 subunit 8 [Argyropelecus hemigymnus]
MPQLNPTPWFAILIFSWFIYLSIMLPKTLAHTFHGKPLHGIYETRTRTRTWYWRRWR